MLDLIIGEQYQKTIITLAIIAGVIVIFYFFNKFKPTQALVGIIAYLALIVSAIFSFGHLNIYYSARGGVYGTITSILNKNEVVIEENTESIDFGFSNVVLVKNSNEKYSASITSKKILKLDANESYFIYVNDQPCTTVSCEEKDIYATYSYTFLNRENSEYLIIADDTMTFYFAFYDNYSYLYIEVENGATTHQLWNQYFNKNNFKVRIVKVPSSFYSPTEYKKIKLTIDGNNYSQVTIKNGSDYLLPTNVENTDDYIFNYWQDSKGNKITAVNNVTEDMTITANITDIHKVTLTYGGVKFDTYNVINGESLTLPQINTTYNGYAYRSWQDSEGNEITAVNNVTQDITISAKPIDIHLVTLMQGATIWKNVEVVNGDNATIPAINVKEGDTLYHGWYYENGTPVEKSPEGYYTINSVTSDLTLHAGTTNYFTVNLITGSTTYSSYYVAEGESLTLPEINITSDNCIYNGWLDENGNTITKIDSVTSNRTIIANEITLYTITYKVDSTVYKTEKLQKDSLLTEPTEPTKNGYGFLYWKDTATGNPVNFATYTVSASTVLEAVFEYGYTYTYKDITSQVALNENGYDSFTDVKLTNTELKNAYNTGDFKEIRIKYKIYFYIVDYNSDNEEVSTEHRFTTSSCQEVEFIIKPSEPGYSQTVTSTLTHVYSPADIIDDFDLTINYTLTNISEGKTYPTFRIQHPAATFKTLPGDAESSHNYKIIATSLSTVSVKLFTV